MSFSSSCVKEENSSFESENLTFKNSIIFQSTKISDAQYFAQNGLIAVILDFQSAIRNFSGAVGVSSTYEFANEKVLLKQYGFVDSKGDFIEL